MRVPRGLLHEGGVEGEGEVARERREKTQTAGQLTGRASVDLVSL
jgi:hypothetical protein